jgi:hypothetical protein
MAISQKLTKSVIPLIVLLIGATSRPPVANGQTPAAQTVEPKSDAPDPTTTVAPQDKRILGVLPNYRTAEKTSVYQPIPPKYKIKIALKDTFDYPLIGLAAAYAGLYQLDDSHPQFGQGAEGYFKRLGTSYTDQMVGNMMTEGFLPVLLKEDPRYFRMAKGPVMRRTGYALSRIFVTKTDAGKPLFNFSEVLGNGIAAAVGLSYYTDDRNLPDYLQNWGVQLATDATSQVLKEFWPDIKHWYKNRHHQESAATVNRVSAD